MPKASATIVSGRQLAGAVGVGEATIRRYLRDPRCPHPRGPWTKQQAEEIRDWATEFLQEDRSGKADREGDGPTALDLARADKQISIQLKIERKAKLMAERLIIEQKYVKRDEHEAAYARKFDAIKKSLQQVAKALRQRLADETDPGRVEEILTGAFRAVTNVGFGGTDASSDHS